MTHFDIQIKDSDCLVWSETDTMDSIFDIFSGIIGAYMGLESCNQTYPSSTYRSNENEITLLSLPLLNFSYHIVDGIRSDDYGSSTSSLNTSNLEREGINSDLGNSSKQQQNLSKEIKEKTYLPFHTLKVEISDFLLFLPSSQNSNLSILHTLTKVSKIFTYDTAEIIRTGQQRLECFLKDMDYLNDNASLYTHSSLSSSFSHGEEEEEKGVKALGKDPALNSEPQDCQIDVTITLDSFKVILGKDRDESKKLQSTIMLLELSDIQCKYSSTERTYYSTKSQKQPSNNCCLAKEVRLSIGSFGPPKPHQPSLQADVNDSARKSPCWLEYVYILEEEALNEVGSISSGNNHGTMKSKVASIACTIQPFHFPIDLLELSHPLHLFSEIFSLVKTHIATDTYISNSRINAARRKGLNTIGSDLAHDGNMDINNNSNCSNSSNNEISSSSDKILIDETIAIWRSVKISIGPFTISINLNQMGHTNHSNDSIDTSILLGHRLAMVVEGISVDYTNPTPVLPSPLRGRSRDSLYSYVIVKVLAIRVSMGSRDLTSGNNEDDGQDGNERTDVADVDTFEGFSKLRTNLEVIAISSINVSVRSIMGPLHASFQRDQIRFPECGDAGVWNQWLKGRGRGDKDKGGGGADGEDRDNDRGGGG